MALFLRRETQRRIDEAAGFMEPEKLKGLVQRLNKSTKVSIEAQWELMWLTAFARIGALQHEVSHGSGTRFLDVHFRSKECEFVADITTASDVGLQDENPVEDFRRALSRLYKKHKMRRGFLLQVGSRMVGPNYRDRKVKLAVPARAKIDSFIKEHFEPFIRRAVQNPDLPARHSVLVEEGPLTLDYNPTRPSNQDAGHTSFDVAYSLRRNPIYNALKAKKEQLKGSGFNGLKGIILCDANCNILRSQFTSGVAYALRDIAFNFLDETTSVDFVLFVGVKESLSIGSDSTISLKPELFCQRKMSDQTMRGLENVLSRALGKIPIPVCATYKAMYLLDRGMPLDAKFGAIASSFRLSHNTSPMELRVSNRLLLGLLSGEVTHEQFRSMHEIRGNAGKPPVYLLEQWAKEGRLITEATFERHEGEDDDHIVLRFGFPDPAATKFRMPDTPRPS